MPVAAWSHAWIFRRCLNSSLGSSLARSGYHWSPQIKGAASPSIFTSPKLATATRSRRWALVEVSRISGCLVAADQQKWFLWWTCSEKQWLARSKHLQGWNGKYYAGLMTNETFLVFHQRSNASSAIADDYRTLSLLTEKINRLIQIF